MKVAIIGGGASGLCAAIAAAENGNDVVILEKNDRVGRKILSTGNGRCNMTNIGADERNYHGEHPEFVRGAINRFWVTETLEFFRTLGVWHKVEENGRVYPYCEQASAVLDVLRMRVESLCVDVRTGAEVKSVRKGKRGFFVELYSGEGLGADAVVVATGGKAAPNLGSTGIGYDILKSFGHRIVPQRPSLVQIKTETDVAKKLKGIKIQGSITLGEITETGEILFTEYGLSGPPVFSASAYLDGQRELYLDIAPEYTKKQLIDMLMERVYCAPKTQLENFFVGVINKRVGQALLKYLGKEPLSRRAATLNDRDIKEIAGVMKKWRFVITGTMSWNNAQTTKGGADTSEFNPDTMESKLVSGLYATGETLDIDGDCGGYNLQWAWSSGILCGRGIKE